MPSASVPGNLGKDPEMVIGTKGGAITNFSLCHDGGRDYKSGDRRKTWFRVTCYNELAEKAVEVLKMGMSIVVKGSIWMDEFERTDGSKGIQPRIECYSFKKVKLVEEDFEASGEAAAVESAAASA